MRQCTRGRRTLVWIATADSGPGCQHQQGFQRIGYLCIRQTIVAMAPLAFHREQATANQFCKMFAGCLRCDIGESGEFSGGERNPPIRPSSMVARVLSPRSIPVVEKLSGI